MRKLVPFGDKVQLEVFCATDESIGTLIHAEILDKKHVRGKVVALGDNVTMNINVGDIVIFNESMGLEITIDRKEYKIISQKDIIGKIEET